MTKSNDFWNETVEEVPYDGGGKLMFDACLNNGMERKKALDELAIEGPKMGEYNGGAVSYYTVHVSSPKTIAGPYDAECSDIIESLNMTFAEGEAFKALWRKAAARLGKRKEGYDNGLYDAEKVAMFGARLVVLAKAESKCDYPDCNCPYDMGADNKCLRGLCTDHLRKGVKL